MTTSNNFVKWNYNKLKLRHTYLAKVKNCSKLKKKYSELVG
jgi:hypothetical protein